jgi:hypothetical protein
MNSCPLALEHDMVVQVAAAAAVGGSLLEQDVALEQDLVMEQHLAME